jgi:hypothetical protein
MSPQMTLLQFPAELLMETLLDLPFDQGNHIRTLKLVHPELNRLFCTYERSIVLALARKELPHAFSDFPTQSGGYQWLARCVSRYDRVDEIMAILMHEMHYVRVPSFNMSLAHTGFLLLWSLSDFGKFKHPSCRIM